MYGRMMTGVALAALLAAPALAQTQGTTGQQQQQPAEVQQQQQVQQQDQQQQQQLAQQDLEFAQKAAEGGLKEVRFGELAQQQASSPEVQQFGQRMVQDHGQANEQLMSIAQQKGIQLPQELPQDAQQQYQELQQLSGQEFDQAYMDEMVSDHQKEIDEFEQYVQEGQDPDLTSFAEQTLPVLEEHLQLAQQTQQQIEQQAVAATGQGQQQQMQQQPTEQQQAQQQVQTGQIQAQEIVGREIVNANGEAIGEISDIVLDQQQQPYAVVSVGGFLGIGEKEVAIPVDQLQIGQDQVSVQTQITEDQLNQMPEYEQDQYQPVVR